MARQTAPQDPRATRLDALARRLQPLLPGLEARWLAECDSTNSLLLERARARPTDCALLLADQQLAGRGRMGRSWWSEPGAALLMSLALPLRPRDWSGLSLAVGVAVADALEAPQAHLPPRIGLKWPNDLWLRDPERADLGAGAEAPWGRKLAGILIETLSVGADRVAVIGLGINVSGQPEGSDAGDPGRFRHGRAALQELDPAATPIDVLERLLEPLALALRRFEAQGLAPFASAFARRDLLTGRPVAIEGAGEMRRGLACGIDAQGALLVQDAQGHRHAVASGDVSVRLPANALEAS